MSKDGTFHILEVVGQDYVAGPFPDKRAAEKHVERLESNRVSSDVSGQAFTYRVVAVPVE